MTLAEREDLNSLTCEMIGGYVESRNIISEKDK
jgi:hypothetical protein